MNMQCPVSLMFWVILSSEDNLMPTHVFLKCATINVVGYTEVLKLWINSVASSRPYFFQQDTKPLNRTRAMQNAWTKILWTSPIYGFPAPKSLTWWSIKVWGVVQSDFNRHLHDTATELRATLVYRIAKTPTTIALFPAVGYDTVQRQILHLTVVSMNDVIHRECCYVYRTL